MEDITPEYFNEIIEKQNKRNYQYIIDIIKDEILKSQGATSVVFPKRYIFSYTGLEICSYLIYLNDYAIKKLKKNGFKVEKFKTKILRKTKYKVSWR